MQHATQEQINASPLARQLWCIQLPDEEGYGMGLVEMQKNFLVASKPDEKIEPVYLATFGEDNIPEDEHEYTAFKMSMFIDTSIAAIAPNLYLLLESLFENKSRQVENYHLAVYEANKEFISSDKKIIEQYPTIERVETPFVWTSDEEGNLINHLGYKVLRFEDPRLAKFASLACSQYNSLSHMSMQATMRKLGAGDFVIFGGGSGQIGAGQLSDQTRAESGAAYQEMKQLVQEMNWDIHAQVLSINNTLQNEY